MTVRNLEHLFRPQSVAVIGASSHEHSIGAIVLHNLVEGEFKGQIFAVNPKYSELRGIKVYPNVGGSFPKSRSWPLSVRRPQPFPP